MSEAAPSSAQIQNGWGRAVDEGDTPPADVDELLSRAHMHAELLRVHAEAARAEAEALRVEAAALRKGARDEAAAATSRAEALCAHVRATADEFLSAIEVQAAATRAEVDRLRTEAESLRRLLQAEIGAGLADARRMRADAQSLWAETDKVAAELRGLSARAATAAAGEDLGGGRGPAHQPDGGARQRPTRTGVDEQSADLVAAGGQHANGRLDGLNQAIAIQVEHQLADLYDEAGRPAADADNPAVDTEMHLEAVLPQVDVGKLLRDIWDAARTESTRVPGPGSPGEPSPWTSHDGPNGAGQAACTDDAASPPPERPRAPAPLIGSGGWRAGSAPSSPGSPVDDPADAKATSPPPEAGRDRRRFRRPR